MKLKDRLKAKLYHGKREKTVSTVPWPVLTDQIVDDYTRIMHSEVALASRERSWHIPPATEMHGTAIRVLDAARLGLVPRSYNERYGLSRAKIAFESVGAHTHLASSIFNAWYNYEYSPYEKLSGRFNCDEAIRRHDLPENITGDIPDAGERNELEKIIAEHSYQKVYSDLAPTRNLALETAVNKLLRDMEEKSSPLGRSIFVADKASALIITLACDKAGIPPKMRFDCRQASARDREEMALCDFRIGRACYASEMWAIDYFHARKLLQYDDTGYYTALIVMCTLLVNSGEWYSWREREYLP